MPSIFGHTFAAMAIGGSYPKKIFSWKFFILGIICATLPDIDVITFKLGIPYGNVLGHRGLTHSLLFAFLLGVSVTFLFYRKSILSLKGLLYISFFSICAISHDLLDAMTNGGLGVGFFIPWDETRYFLPWRVIQVSPIGIRNFSEKAVHILTNEMLWIGIPCIVYVLLLRLVRK
jgi:inner membrane protein